MDAVQTSLPAAKPFSYIWIPADDAQPVTSNTFAEGSDAEVRQVLTRHFAALTLSDAQKEAMAVQLRQQADENAKRNAVKPKMTASEDAEKPSTPEDNKDYQKALIDQYIGDTSYEIIPIVMPTRASHFIGTSLYIDDSGAFKELPINARASKIAQRAIRGDAFLLSNHDDPALDEWGRVDCPMSRYTELYAHPPTTSYDASNQAQMTKMALLRDADTKKISREDVDKAKIAKDDGNRLFSAGDLKAAVQAYSLAVDLTEGRRDLLDNEAEVTALRVSVLLNRALCQTRLHQCAAAVTDALTAASLEPKNAKTYYRLAHAQLGQHDGEAALQTAQQFEDAGGAADDVKTLRAAAMQCMREQKAKEKQQFAKMFR